MAPSPQELQFDEHPVILDAHGGLSLQLLAALQRLGQRSTSLRFPDSSKNPMPSLFPVVEKTPESFNQQLEPKEQLEQVFWIADPAISKGSPLEQEYLETRISLLSNWAKKNPMLQIFALFPIHQKATAIEELQTGLKKQTALFFAPALFHFGDNALLDNAVTALRGGHKKLRVEKKETPIAYGPDAVAFMISASRMGRGGIGRQVEIPASEYDLEQWLETFQKKLFNQMSPGGLVRKMKRLFSSTLLDTDLRAAKENPIAGQLMPAQDIYPSQASSLDRAMREIKENLKAPSADEILLHYPPSRAP